MFQYVAREEYVEYLGLVYELDLGHHFLTSQFYKDKFYLCDDVDSNLNMFHYTILLEYVDTKLIGKTANSYKFMTFCLKFNQTLFLLGKLPNTFHFPQNKLSCIELNNNENLDLWNTLLVLCFTTFFWCARQVGPLYRDVGGIHEFVRKEVYCSLELMWGSPTVHVLLRQGRLLDTSCRFFGEMKWVTSCSFC